MAYNQQAPFNPGVQQPHGYSQPPYGYPPPAGGFYPPTSGPQHYPPPNAQMNYGQQQPNYGQQQSNYGQQQPNYGQQQPIITQQPVPGAQMSNVPLDGWISVPSVVPTNCPNGLQYLTTLDQLMVKQKVELLEAFIGFETNNKYTIKNSQGDKIYYAVEENDCCTRMCCGPLRSFDIKILDRMRTEIIHLKRDFACDTCWFPCCLQHMEVYAPPGNLVGSIQQTWSICNPEFDIKNHHGETVLKIEGPVCRYGICGDVEFKVLSRDKSCVVGKISKQWSGLIREAFTDADNFGISFPLDLDVRMKAVMLGACFLIDFMYFEKRGDNRERDGIGLL